MPRGLSRQFPSSLHLSKGIFTPTPHPTLSLRPKNCSFLLAQRHRYSDPHHLTSPSPLLIFPRPCRVLQSKHTPCAAVSRRERLRLHLHLLSLRGVRPAGFKSPNIFRETLRIHRPCGGCARLRDGFGRDAVVVVAVVVELRRIDGCRR